MSYRHILIATDTLNESDELLSLLKDMASHQETKLSFTRALQNLTHSGLAYSLPSLTAIERSLIDSAKQQLKSMGKQMSEYETDEIVEFGRPADVILDKAKQLKVDLIIVGNDKRHFFDATAASVLHHAPCDILAINS